MSLTTLPPELFSCIVASIESQSTLCNLTQCSRQVYLWTTPHLYYRVTLREEFRPEERQNRRLRKLASLLIQRPDLARLVRSFSLDVHPASRTLSGTSEVSEDFANLSTPFEANQTFNTAVRASSLSNEDKNTWLRELSPTQECHPDLILALLLPALIKVEKLVLDLRVGFHTHYLDRILRGAAHMEKPFNIQPLFDGLRVFITSYDYFNVKNTGFMASLLKLPAIQVISAGLGNEEMISDGEDKDLIELESFSSPLLSLALGVVALSKEDLGHILRAPKALKTFSYKFCSDEPLYFTEIRHALRPQEKCLESLGFDYDDASFEPINGMGLDTDDLPSMTSFVSFNALKVFKIAAVFLENTDHGTERQNLINIFPPNLETLHLTRFEARFESILEAVVHLLSQKSAQQIPSLKKLILEEIKWIRPRPNDLRTVTWRGSQETAIGRLTTVAAAQGVSVDVIFRDQERFWYVHGRTIDV